MQNADRKNPEVPPSAPHPVARSPPQITPIAVSLGINVVFKPSGESFKKGFPGFGRYTPKKTRAPGYPRTRFIGLSVLCLLDESRIVPGLYIYIYRMGYLFFSPYDSFFNGFLVPQKKKLD